MHLSFLTSLLPPRRTFSGALLLAGLGSAGCSISADFSDGVQASVNSCSADAECGEGICRRGTCEAASSEFSTLLVQVTPPADSTRVAGVAFTQVVELDGRSLDVELEHVSDITGRVTGATLPSVNCVSAEADDAEPAPDGTFPVRVTMVPRERLLGVPNPSQTREITPGDGQSYSFSMSIPPGEYDIYTEPLAMDGSCVRPPHLLVGQEIAPGDVSLDLKMPAPEKLELVVRWPGESDSLADWSVDIVERDSLRRISNQAVLSNPVTGADGVEYQAELAFSPVMGSAPANELVRLVPPESVAAPTVYFDRSVVELFQEGTGVIDQLESLPAPVRFSGRVNRSDSTLAAEASVTLRAIELDQLSPGTVASFTRTTKTDEEGFFSVELVPGTYEMVARPSEEGLATARSEVVVTGEASVQEGAVIEVSPQHLVSGPLRSFDGSTVSGVTVEAIVPPQPKAETLPDRVGADLSASPRAGSSLSDGSFELLADDGTYHLVARPEAGSGFPWAVELSVSVGDSEQAVVPLELSLPFVVSGQVVSADVGVVPSALIRAYGYVENRQWTNDPTQADSVVPIAEARADAEGRFRLILPSRF